MKISWNYLQSFFNGPLAKDLILERLTMAGLEVESVSSVAPEFSGIVVAEVVECVKHPEADKLSLCKIDAGTGELLQILCGASNVKVGVKVPCAKIGAVLPGDFKITERKMRGLVSYGMLCSSEELGQANGVDGLLLLPTDAPIGCDIREYLDLDDSIIEFKITPNRGDCLSYHGLVREIAALSGVTAKPLIRAEESLATSSAEFTLQVTASDECPHYVGLKIHQVNNNQASPAWLVRILERSSIRSISAVVDITNYVLLVTGQPMHAFDLTKIGSGIQVRLAVAGEELTLIDGTLAKLAANTLLITNGADQPVAIAGVMGGLDSAVTTATTSIVLESAYFNPTTIAGKSKQYGVSSDAAFRYERGVDSQIQHDALNLAAELISEICGGVGAEAVHYQNPVPTPRLAITLTFAEINQFIGQVISSSQIIKILTDLGCQLTYDEMQLSVTSPSYRFDLAIKADIIEEVIRVFGYDNIQAQMPKLEYTLANIDAKLSEIDQFKQTLASRGFNEIISYAFIDEKYALLFAAKDQAQVKLQNPLANLAVMRTNLISGLVKTLQYNVNRGQECIKLFELARVFHGEEATQQPLYLAALLYGDFTRLNWSAKPRQVDFFDLKIVLEELLGNYAGLRFTAESSHPSCHPGRTATVWLDQVAVGYIGQLHPKFSQELGLENMPYLFEVNLELLKSVTAVKVIPTSKFQKVSRDLAWVFASSVAVGDVKAQIATLNLTELRSVREFDVFHGVKQASPGLNEVKSIAFNFIFQGDKTLNDEDINHQLDLIKAKVAGHFAAELRV